MMGAYNPAGNKGKPLEDLIEYQNDIYAAHRLANVQKINTAWSVIRKGGQIVGAYPGKKSTLDFRGTVKGGIPISFDAKESEDENGLPLKHIRPHQIEYIRHALPLGEVSFVLCHMKKLRRYYIIPGHIAVSCWDQWQHNKGRRGYNTIPLDRMVEIKKSAGNALDYISTLRSIYRELSQ